MEMSVLKHKQRHAKPILLVAGGNGFLGSHVSKFYHEQGYRVRIVDNVAESKLDPYPFFSERVIGNLCDINVCRHAVRGAVVVLHFAAMTGGAGMIDSRNDHIIYRTNQLITQNLLEVALAEGVHTFFLASSAAVYPNRPQADLSDVNAPLKEDAVYEGLGERPEPQGGYGLEKLHAEELLFQYTDRLKICIGRFHSIYGPGNVWSGGRDRAPAALLRKALALKLTGEQPSQLEVWGDGFQQRSFLYIDDAVKAVVALVDAKGPRPALNIAHSESTSIRELAELSLEVVGLDPSSVDFIFRTDKPVGVASRSSDNSLIEHELGWRPEIDLREGLKRTGDWMSEQMQQALANANHTIRHDVLGSFMKSKVVDMASLSIKFAVLIPITSRGVSPELCIHNLRSFAHSLHETTWRDRTELGATPYEVHIYLAIDEDDHYLRPTSDDEEGRAEGVLREYGFSIITTLYCNHPRGHVCALWRDCARRAFDDKCDYYVLMGDDVVLLDEGWMRTINAKFAEIATSSGGPHGFGCVAFTDRSFPGMPTFPVVHRTHMEIFEGEVVPEAFINQDGDPYLFQMYRHFGASTTVPSRLCNSIGGSDDARYQKESLTGWTFETLENGKQAVAKWSKKYAPAIRQMVSIDIIVPSYRVDLNILKRILHLQPSPTCTTMFIIIIDNPHSSELYELRHTYSHRMDVRIRVNKSNMGASATRNRGLSESSAEWVIFLDDDVVPVTEFLVEVEKAVRAHPDAAGFVGNTYFPVAPNIYTTGVHLAGMTHFWNIADKLKEDIPWGITANLVVRRNIRDGIEFRLSFPKTGGGEDIDFCRRKREASLRRGGTAFWAAPKALVVHPWWSEGRRTYRRFFMWAYGDGALIKMYPELAWRDWTPNSAELLLFASFLGVSGVGLGLCQRGRAPVIAGSALLLSTMISNIFHDMLRHHITDRRRAMEFHTSVGRIGWTCAAMEGGLIRMTSEMGRLVGLLQRGEWFYIGARFDWYAGRSNAIHEEWSNGLQRFGLVAALSVVMFRLWYK